MTDEQFDEICRNSLAFDPGNASGSMWTKIRPPKRSWLPTIPEICGCGCACALLLAVLDLRLSHQPVPKAESNSVIEKAIGGSFVGLQASAERVPNTTPWTEFSLSKGAPEWTARKWR